jgi:hypothetical protein
MSDQTTNDLLIGGRALPACCAEREALRARVRELEAQLATLRAWMGEYPNDKYTGAWWLSELARIESSAALRGKEPQA